MNPVQRKEGRGGRADAIFPESERAAERGSDIGGSVGGCEEGDTGAGAVAEVAVGGGGGAEVLGQRLARWSSSSVHRRASLGLPPFPP